MFKMFRKRAICMPDHPEVAKAYSYKDYCIYINTAAKPGAKVVLFEAPNNKKAVSTLPR